jgi:hypothetical protein
VDYNLFRVKFQQEFAKNMITKTFSAYRNSRGWLFVFLAAALGFIIYSVPPLSSGVIIAFVLLLSLFITTFFSFFLRLRDSLFIGVTVGLLLALNAYFGLNPLNNVLLISFVLGLRFLVQ